MPKDKTPALPDPDDQRVPAPDSLAAVLRRKKPRTARVAIPLDPEWGDEVAEAQKRVERARRVADTRPDSEDAAAYLADAEAVLDGLLADGDDKAQVFTMRGLPPAAYQAIVDAHQPTAAARKKAEAQGGSLPWDPATFPQALVAACLVEPAATPGEVDEMFTSGDWNSGELGALFDAAVAACTGTANVAGALGL